MRRPWASEPTPAKGRLWLAMLGVIALAVLTWGLNQGGFSGGGRDGDTDPSTLPAVALTSLPAEAQQTVTLIDAGGPFPYDRTAPCSRTTSGCSRTSRRGYYHEYTVTTPGSTDRGARRIITGSGSEMYWTDDHYQSFERIVP